MTATDTPEQLEADGREPALGYYLGRPVTGATLQIAGTGAGLDRGLEMPQVALQPGDHYDVVLRCVVTEHRHEFSEEYDAYQLVNRLKAVTATIPKSGETAADAIARAKAAIEKRADGVDDRQLTIDDTDGPRGGEPQTVGQVAEDVLDIAQQLEDGANVRDARTKELDNPTDYTVDDLRSLAGEYDIAGRSKMTRVELVDAIVEWEWENGQLGGGEDGA